ncbi:MAG: O-antigen ligase family protein [Candidatus Saccharibacteria bacterium]|nr:O-antigen ligase family protein [Candidatus Saccharibacteria bacterium]
MLTILTIALLPLLLLGQLLRFPLAIGGTIYPHDVVIVAILTLALGQHAVRSELIRWLRSHRLLLGTIAWFFVAPLAQIVLLNHSPALVLYVLRFLCYATFLWWFAFSKNRIHRFDNLFQLSGLAFAIIALGMYLFIPDMRVFKAIGWDDHYFRAVGPLLDPNFAAAVLVIGITSSIAWLSARKPSPKWLPYAVLLPMAVALGLTFSRSGWMALLVAIHWLVICVIVQRLRNQSNAAYRKIVGPILFSLVILTLTLLLAPKPGGEGIELSRTTSITARESHDRATLNLSPPNLMFGFGLTQPPDGVVSYHAQVPNNLWLQLLAFGGIPGLALSCLVCLQAITRSKKITAISTVPFVALFVLAQFNAVLIEPFVFLLSGMQIGLVFSRKQKKA